ncbi:MAG: zinc-dependent peptidase [Salinisphaera sp.]|nr:zinc-dependent peptidase [Salinisphaera sp.]
MNGLVVFLTAGAGIGALCVIVVSIPALFAGRRRGKHTTVDQAHLRATVPVYQALDADQRQRLEQQARRFLRQKKIRTTDSSPAAIMPAAVAGNACMLRLAPGADCYPMLREVVLDGEAEPPGRLAVGWNDLYDAIAGGPRNPLAAACAELLLADARKGQDNAQWWQRWHTAQAAFDPGASPLLCVPGNQPALFVCATEAFFQRGATLAQDHRELYELLSEYYQLDPVRGHKSTNG